MNHKQQARVRGERGILGPRVWLHRSCGHNMNVYAHRHTHRKKEKNMCIIYMYMYIL